MSSPPTVPAPDAPPGWPILSINERRVLGVLVEKGKTTPDAYPLTLNGLITGCNQKSSRDPILDLNDLDVEDALGGCQKKNLVFKITGSRVDRYRHNLYDAWQLNKVELAIIGELLLRGAQTEGELRGRANRMEPIADVDALRAALKPLANRGLVVYLTEEGRRGTTLTHGFHSPKDLERLRAKHPADAAEDAEPAIPPPSPAASRDADALETKVAALQADIALLREQVASLQTTVATLQQQLNSLKDALGA